MRFLHLDKNFKPYGDSMNFETFTFSGGEPHIKIHEKPAEGETVMITQRVKSFNDLGFILIAADALKRMGVARLELFLPYFPAARQDRLMIPGEPLTVKVMAELINAVGFTKVTIVDPHSEVTPALLNNVEVIKNHDFVKNALQKINADLNKIALVSPDGGAAKKIFGLAKSLGGVEVIEAGKIRDVKTGKLKDFRVYVEELNGKDCVVIDDICDGGGTFMGLAKALKEKGAGKLTLIVTHGIFSRGVEELKEHYDQILCSNSFSELNFEGVEQMEITN